MTDHDDQAALDPARLERLRQDVVAGAPPRPVGGARSARRTGVRRRATRLVGVAAAVAAVVVAVPLGLGLTDGATLDEGLQVATQEADPTATTGPPPPSPSGTGAAVPGADAGTAPVTAVPPSTGPGTGVVAPGASPAPTGAVELHGPPAEDEAALAAATLIEATATELGGVQIASPSGNVRCGMHRTETRCTVGEADWSLPRPPDCGTSEESADWEPTTLVMSPAQRADPDAGDAVVGGFVADLGYCGTDSALGPDPIVLGYGTAVVMGDVRCTSLRTGLTCQDLRTGSGFRVSRAAALVW
jgi:hypothetical protein